MRLSNENERVYNIPYALHPNSHRTLILDNQENMSVFDNLKWACNTYKHLKWACNAYKHAYPVPYTLILDYMLMSLEPKTCTLNGSRGSYSSWIRVYGRGYVFSYIVIHFTYTHENINKM